MPKIPWNKGKKSLQIPWNKGKKGLQVAWNRGKTMPQIVGENNPFYGKKHTEESRRKMSEAVKRSWDDPQYQQKMSKIRKGRISVMKGRHHSDETKKKLSEAVKQKWSDPEYRGRILESKKNILDETRRKISEAGKGRISWNKGLIEYSKGHKISEEARRRISESKKGKKHSEESRRKNSEAVKARWKDPEYRRRISEANKGKILPEETRKKISEALKGRTLNKEHRRKLAKATRRIMSDPEFRKNQSRRIKLALENPEIRKILVEKRKYQKFPKRDTIPEKMMQDVLRSDGIEFTTHRPFKINNSYHQVDLFIEPNICIEIDGYYWHNRPNAKARDVQIDNVLKSEGLQVLRFVVPAKNRNFDVKSCLQTIKETMRKRSYFAIP